MDSKKLQRILSSERVGAVHDLAEVASEFRRMMDREHTYAIPMLFQIEDVNWQSVSKGSLNGTQKSTAEVVGVYPFYSFPPKLTPEAKLEIRASLEKSTVRMAGIFRRMYPGVTFRFEIP